MKAIKKFFKITIKVLVSLFVFLVVFGLIITKLSNSDYGTPNSKIGDRINQIAIRNASIISMVDNDSLIKYHKTILIENDRIKDIVDDSIKIPATYKVIDIQGKFVTPGLIDMHAHIFDRSDLPMYLGYGVTTVRNMMGFPMHLRWRDQIKSGEYPGAVLITSSPTINSGSDKSPFHNNINNVKEGIAAVKKYKERGYDFIKIYGGLTKEELEGIVKEAKNNGLYVAGHPPKDIELDEYLKYGINSFEHVEEVIQAMMNYKLDTILGRQIAKKLSASKARITITLAPFQNIYRATLEGDKFIESIPKDKINPFTRFIGKKQLSEWVNTNEGAYKWNKEKYECMEFLTKILYEENVELLLGTDTGPSLTIPGITVHDEISLLNKIGIPNFDILKSGTINATKALGLSDELGTVEIGKKSELVISDLNPLEEISTLRNPSFILSNGMLYNESAIKELRQLGLDKSSFLLTIGRFIDHMVKK